MLSSNIFKKSQITLFVIIGLIIAITASLLFFINKGNNNIETKNPTAPEIIPIKLFVDSCLEKTLEKGIYYLGMQGGYYNVDEPLHSDGSKNTPYYFYFGQTFFPTKETIEKSLGEYISENTLACLNDFLPFKEKGFDIINGNLNVNVNIQQENIGARVELPLTVYYGESQSKLNIFESNIDFNFMTIYKIIEKIRDEQIKNMNYIPMGALADLAYHNNFTFKIVEYPNNSIVYYLVFNYSELKEPYIFSFATKYDWDNLSGPQSKPVEIENINAQTAYVGYEYILQVKVKGSNLRYYDYTTLFEIDENSGLIKFTPTENQGGKHYIIINVKDDQGNEDTKTFKLEVKENNNPPYIESIPNFIVETNSNFKFQVKASDPENDTIFYIDDTNIFEINPLTGLIDFTTTEDMKGTHIINITVVDVKGHKDNDKFELVIE